MKPHQIHTWMGRIGSIVNHAIVWLMLSVQLHLCSEFPERECCDPIYPLIPELDQLPPALPTTTISSSSSSYAVGGAGGVLSGRSGKCWLLLWAFELEVSLRCKEKISNEKVWFNLIPLEIAMEISRRAISPLFSDIEFPFPIENFSSPSHSTLMDINSILKLLTISLLNVHAVCTANVRAGVGKQNRAEKTSRWS